MSTSMNIKPAGLVIGILVLCGLITTGIVLMKKQPESVSGFPLQHGSKGKAVSRLQAYLKRQGADLGRSGTNKDGIDGHFGDKTLAALKSTLGKNTLTAKEFKQLF